MVFACSRLLPPSNGDITRLLENGQKSSHTGIIVSNGIESAHRNKRLSWKRRYRCMISAPFFPNAIAIQWVLDLMSIYWQSYFGWVHFLLLPCFSPVYGNGHNGYKYIRLFDTDEI